MRELTLYVTIKCRVRAARALSDDEVASEVAENCDYLLRHESENVKVMDTELVDCEFDM